MIAAAAVLTQLYLSCAALLGLYVLQSSLARRDAWDPINRRFIFALRITMLLFAGRILMVATGVEAFRIMVLFAAAMVPLAVLLLTEGLLRRHAPAAFKAYVGGGAALFALTSLWYSFSIDPPRLASLLVFQVSGLMITAWLIVTRDKTSLSQSENTMVVRLGLSLFLLIPLAASDFLLLYIGLPIQISALGVLILCWLSIGLSRPYLNHRATFIMLAVMTVLGAFVGTMLGFFAGLERDGYLLTIAAVLTTLFLVTILNDARQLRDEAQSFGLLTYLARVSTDDTFTFLKGLEKHPLLQGAATVSHKDLARLDDTLLGEIFKASPILRRNALPQLGPAADDHIAYLFEHYEATHIMLAQRQPRVLVALSLPSLSAAPTAELELQVVQRMALLMAEKEGSHDD